MQNAQLSKQLMVQKNANPAHSFNSHRTPHSIIEQPCMNPYLFLSPGNFLFIRIFSFSFRVTHSVLGAGKSNKAHELLASVSA